MGTEQDHLIITVREDPNAPPTTWELWDNPPRGTHPDPEAACAALRRSPESLDPVPPGTISAQIYGGPQTASVRGYWSGRSVNARFQRNNAAEMARWASLSDLLGTVDR